jgi:hypothetical protein
MVHRAFCKAPYIHFRHRASALLQALQFVKSGQYVNTARVDPKHLYADNHRLKNADSKMLTIGIMTGTTTESFILSPCEGGPRHSPWNMHKVTIAPFTQDMRRDTSLWGLVLDFHVIAGLTSSLGFTFSTRAEGHGDSQNTCMSFPVPTFLIADCRLQLMPLAPHFYQSRTSSSPFLLRCLPGALLGAMLPLRDLTIMVSETSQCPYQM